MLKKLLNGGGSKQQAAAHDRLKGERVEAEARLETLAAEADGIEAQLDEAAAAGEPTAQLRTRLREIADEADDLRRRIEAIDQGLKATRGPAIRAEIKRIEAEIAKENASFEPVRKARLEAEAAFERAQAEYNRAVGPHVGRVNALHAEREKLEQELVALEAAAGEPA